MSGVPLKNFDLKAHYESFQRSYGIDPDTGEPLDPKLNTKIGNQFDAAQVAFETGARLSDAKDLLSAHMKIIADPASSDRRVKRAASQISDTIIPVIELAVKSTQSSAQRVSPIPGGKYAFNRMEKKMRNDAQRDAGSTQPKLERVKEFLRKANDSSSPATPAKKTAPHRRSSSRRAKYQLPLRVRARRPQPIIPTPPEPDNKQTGVYGVGEFLKKINERTEEGTKQRAEMIKAMQNAPYKYLPVSPATVYRYIKAHKKGTVFQYDEAWPGVGRKPLLADDALAKCAAKLTSSYGQKHMKEQVNEILIESLRLKGQVVGSTFQFNSTTLNNYRALLAKMANLTLTKESNPKTNARFTAEHSLIGTVAYLIVIAMTHFYVVEEETVEWRETLKKIPDEDKLLYHMVQAFHGGKPIRARHPFLVFCADDMTDYLVEGLQPNKNSEIGLVGRSSLQFRGSESTYHHEDSKKFDGVRVKRHLITNAAGDAAPAVFAFCGLTEREMPKKDFIVWDIPGLCPGGHGVGGSSKPGYVLFMRGKDSPGMEKRRFRWIRESVFFPFVKDCRVFYLKLDADSGAPLDEEHIATAWNDGDNSQLATIIEEDGIGRYQENGVNQCKHGAGTTAGQQSNDRMSCFKNAHKMNKTITLVHVPADRNAFKAAIDAKFDQFAAKGLLFFKKRRQAVDYLAKQQVILTRTLGEPEKIVRGYIANGMLDEATRTLPVLSNILRVNKRLNTLEQQKLVFDTFPKLMHYSYPNGMRYIPDEAFLELGYPVDIDAYGKEVVNTNGISREWRQRAKCLTGADAIQQRAKRALEIEIERKRKAEEKAATSEQKASEDRATVERLCGYANVAPSRANLVHVELEHLNRENATVLRAFYANRSEEHTTPSSANHLKKPRGRALADALRGVSNLLTAAHAVRTKPSRLLDQEEGPVQQGSNEGTVAAPPLVARFDFNPDAGAVQPSVILCNSHKVDVLCALFDADDKLTKKVRYFVPPTNLEPEKSLVAKADKLAAMLRARLPNHVRLRVKLSKQSHWCLAWARKNLAVVASYMVYAGHTKDDISCLDASKCLLAKPSGTSNFLMPTNTEATLSGAYLHFDKNEEEWVRSGSSMGKDGFAGRLGEHVDGAKAERNDSNSLFYHLYPHSTSARANNPARRGYFEYLQAYLAVSFSRDEASPAIESELFSKDYHEGGIFFYTDEEKERVRRTSFSKKEGELKFVQMAAYLFELGYDLALSLKHNVSESPGFEGCGLIFEGRRDRAWAELGLGGDIAGI